MEREKAARAPFDIDKVSFKNVNGNFEKKFRERYEQSIKMISDDFGGLVSAIGSNSLDILEKMAQRIEYYDMSSDFEDSYHQLLKEYEPFTET